MAGQRVGTQGSSLMGNIRTECSVGHKAGSRSNGIQFVGLRGSYLYILHDFKD